MCFGGGGGGGGSVAAMPIEPMKSAEETMKTASDSSMRATQLRKGIASTFNRPEMASGATAGQGSKLGG